MIRINGLIFPDYVVKDYEWPDINAMNKHLAKQEAYNEVERQKRIWNKINLEIKEMEKKKMTRDEAFAKTDHLMGNRSFIATLEALGLIKFEEPKTAEAKAGDVMRHYLSDEGAANLLALLSKAGLKIVEK